MSGPKTKLRLLITAGPTREPIDPVRFISNKSTGALGYELAKMARAKGFDVTLISGPTGLAVPKGVARIDVETAVEMEQAVLKNFPKADVLVMSAAVSDFRPVLKANKKIKRSGIAGSMRLFQIDLIENPDILVRASEIRKNGQAVIGFALETENLLVNARHKLVSKNLDAIIATQLRPKQKSRGPFGDLPVDGAILQKGGKTHTFRGLAKDVLAARILKTAEAALAARRRK
jgi:phosphopantothenoylcysteine decarboxylase/phosphopantothenate--cysteine ligase